MGRKPNERSTTAQAARSAYSAASTRASITATATDPDGNTSEFSACREVVQTEVAYNWHYTYDALGRLTAACSIWNGTTCDGDEFTFTTDGAGNLTTLSRWDATAATVETVAYLYNGANQIRCVDADSSGACDNGEFEWVYDAYGNLLDDGTTTYTYDAALRLTSVTDGASTSTFTYNGDGDRVAQTVDGTLTTYILDTATPLTMVLAETTGTDTIYYLHGLDLVAQSDGATTEYFAYDALGSVRQMLDESGGARLTQTYDPYGGVYASAGPGAPHYGFTGEQVDASGLIYLRARYYSPSMGRFLNADPSRQESNPYQYGGANPVMFTDPSGLCAEGDAACQKVVDILESRYNFVFYWPRRASADYWRGLTFTNALSNLVFLNDIATCQGTSVSTSNPTPVVLFPWSVDELSLVGRVLGMMESVLGRRGVQNITRGGILYRVNILSDPSYAGLYCPSGDCGRGPGNENFASYHMFEGVAYSLGLSNNWANLTQIHQTHALIHEFGHRTIDVLPQGYNVANEISRAIFAVPIPYELPPTYRSRSNSRECFAETFACYIRQAVEGPPPPSSLDLSIYDSPEDYEQNPPPGRVVVTSENDYRHLGECQDLGLIPVDAPFENLRDMAYHNIILPLRGE